MDITLNELPILNNINELKVEIDSLRPLSKEQEERIMQKFRLDWNYHSNAIEGNSLDFGETHAFLMHGLTAKGKPFKDYLDVRGHNDAINYLLALIQSGEVITEKDIRALHEILLIEPYDSSAQTPEGLAITKRIHLGEYKKLPNSVKTITGEMHYYTAPEDTVHEMGKLMDWYKEIMETKSLNPIVFAALFHHRFVSIHPFDDGNGRMSRLLMNLILMKFQYPPVVIKETLKSEYYLHLSQADAGKLGPFVEFIAKQMISSLETYLKGAKGESLEDSKDLDMKLALFKKEIDGQPDKIELKRSPEVLLNLKESSIIPLINDLRITLFKFRDFFLDYSEGILIPAKYENSEEKWHYYTRDVEKSINIFIEKNDKDIFAIYFLLDEFKRKENSFSIEVKLVIEFLQLSYSFFLSPSISINSNKFEQSGFLFWRPKKIVEKYYHQILTIEEIKYYVSIVGDEAYNLMSQLHKNEYKSFSDLISNNSLLIKWREFYDTLYNEYKQYVDQIIEFNIENNDISIKLDIDRLNFNLNKYIYINIADYFSIFIRNSLNKYDPLNVKFSSKEEF